MIGPCQVKYRLLHGRLEKIGEASADTAATETCYISGAQRPARGPHPARDESSYGPRCPARKVTIYAHTFSV